jgi:predicted ATPase
MITKIKIKNYKSVRSAEVNLDERFNVIFGRNAAGKSNFVSAIYLLKKLVDNHDLDSIVINKIAPLTGEFFYWKNNDNHAEFVFWFNSKTAAYVFSFEIALLRTMGHFGIQKESLRKIVGGKEVAIYRRDRDASFSGPEDNPIPFKTDPRRLMLTSYSDMANDTADAIQVLRNFTLVDSAIEAREGLTIVPASKPNLDSIDGLAVSLFIKNGGRFQAACETVRKIMPYFEAPSVQPLDDTSPSVKEGAGGSDTGRYLVTWNERDIRAEYSHHSLSHGDKRVISLVFNLFNSETGSILAVEEIENGMHYGRIKRLLDEFRTQANNRDIQILLTTHNHEILNEVKPYQAIHCRKDAQEGTLFVRLTDSSEYAAIKEDLGREPTAAEMIASGLYQ